jgi:signal transduction histidine kinase
VALVDTPVVVFNQDLDLRYIWIYNPQNYADPPIVGKTDADLFSPEDAMRLTALKRRVIESGLLTREEVSITVGSQILFYDMTFNPLFDKNGSVTGLTCAATNITQQKQIEEDIRKRLAESEGIQKIAKGLLLKIGLDEVLEIVCTEAMQLTNAKGSAVLLLDEQGWLRLTHRAGSPMYTLDRLPVEGSLAGRAVQTGSYVWANRQKSDPDETTDQWQGFPWTPGLLSMLSVPLKVDVQTIGVLNILDKPGELTQEDMRILDLFADQAAIIIEHVRLQHQAEQFAVLEERQRLARELHDSVTQALYSVTLYADAGLLAFSRKRWEALERNLLEVRTMAREAMYDMRLLVFELRPLMLEQEGLVSALRSRLAAVEARTGLKTEVLVEGERRLQIGTEELIYRIAQEGLNNVVKHAKATTVQIQLKYDENTVRLEMIDNGLGFDPENARQSGGLGLQGIQERVQQSSGRLKIESAPGKGTRLTITIPISTSDLNTPVENVGR